MHGDCSLSAQSTPSTRPKAAKATGAIMADNKSQIARQHEDNRKHGSAAGAMWIAIAIVIALIIVSAVYWGDHNGNTNASGSAVNSRSITGSDTSSTGAR